MVWRKHSGSRLRSMTQLDMVRLGSRLRWGVWLQTYFIPKDSTLRTQPTVLGVSKLGRRKLSGPRLGGRSTHRYSHWVGKIWSLGGHWVAAVTGWAFAHSVNILAEALDSKP